MTVTNMTITINGGRTVTGGSAMADHFSRFIGFGDSSTDTGYFFAHQISGSTTNQNLYNAARVAGGGLPTDPGYQMHTTFVAQTLGLSAIAVGQTNGMNYAASGATISGNGVTPFAPSIVQQIATYLAENGNVADSNALYYLSGGGNSVTVAETLYPSVAQQAAYMETEAHAFSAAIRDLWLAGARHIVLQNGNGGLVARQSFNATLWADLETYGINFVLADDRNLVRQVIDNPTPYGITNTIRPPEGPFTASDPYDPTDGDHHSIPVRCRVGRAMHRN